MRSPFLQFALFITIGTTIIVGWHYYLWLRLVRDTALAQPWRSIATIAIVLLGLSMPVNMALSRSLPQSVVKPVSFLVFGWMGLAFLLLATVLATDLLRGLASLGLWIGASNALHDPARRLTLSRIVAGAASAVAVGTATWGVVRARGNPFISRIRIPLRRLPASMDGTSIVQISDLHAGLTIHRQFIQRIVDRVNSLSPDVVAITGDLADGSVASLRDAVEPLSKLKARYGVFFVTGNHEYYSGVDGWVAELRRLGIRVLRNERVSIGEGADSYDLAGVDDWSARGFGHGHDLPAALKEIDPQREVVLLAHQPKSVLQASTMGVGLQLSGHTHGGQIFPWNYLVRLQQPAVAGLYRFGETLLYVNRGTGYWGPPLRVGAPPEITRLELYRG